MKKTLRQVIRGAAAAASLLALSTAVSPTPAQAAGTYSGMIRTYGLGFIADFCVLSTTSSNARASCTGNIGTDTSKRFSVPYNAGDKVWLDMNVVAGKDHKRIDLQGKRYIEVRGTIGAVTMCAWNSLEHYQSPGRGHRIFGTEGC